jgi:hypothetical protein
MRGAAGQRCGGGGRQAGGPSRPLLLQGFGRVRVNAVLASAASVLEMAGSAAVLTQLRTQPAAAAGGSGRELLAVGCVTCACQGLLAAASLACVAALPPPEARGRVHLARDVFGLRRGAGWEQGGSPVPADGPRQPLLGSGGDGSDVQEQPQGRAGEPPAAAGGRLRLLDAPTLEFLRWCRRCARLAALFAGLLPSKRMRCLPACSGAARRWYPSPPDLARLAPARQCCRDGRDMFIRSLLLQLTFFAALAAASRLGTAALAGDGQRCIRVQGSGAGRGGAGALPRCPAGPRRCRPPAAPPAAQPTASSASCGWWCRTAWTALPPPASCWAPASTALRACPACAPTPSGAGAGARPACLAAWAWCGRLAALSTCQGAARLA